MYMCTLYLYILVDAVCDLIFYATDLFIRAQDGKFSSYLIQHYYGRLNLSGVSTYLFIP